MGGSQGGQELNVEAASVPEQQEEEGTDEERKLDGCDARPVPAEAARDSTDLRPDRLARIAVLAAPRGSVVTVERDPMLALDARRRIDEMSSQPGFEDVDIEVRIGDGALGVVPFARSSVAPVSSANVFVP